MISLEVDARPRTVARPLRAVELGRLLRAHRERLLPGDLGLVGSGRRHVKGLRREEVASAAGISTTWYTRLEQGRDVQPSRDVLDALARTLRLDDAARAYMYWLAGLGGPQPASEIAGVGPLVALVHDIAPAPAFAMSPTHDLLGWNESYALLFGDPGTVAPEHRNALWLFLTSGLVHERVTDWESSARSMIAHFRAHRAIDGRHERFDEVARSCAEHSPLFRELWPLHEVQRYVSAVEEYRHPVAGVIRSHVLKVGSFGLEEEVSVVIRQPADARSQESLATAVAHGAP